MTTQEQTQVIEEKKEETKEKIEQSVPVEEAKTEKPEKHKDKKTEIQKVKKEEATAKGLSFPISKKHSIYICRFILNKSVDKAISDLSEVIKLKKPVPYKGEIPQRKGGIKGRYPVNAAKHFIKLLKGLKENVVVNGLELEKIKIYFASATWASRPQRRGGKRAKRTNIILKVKEFPDKTAKENKK